MQSAMLKSIFLKNVLNVVIQKIAKTALPHSLESMGQFLQILGSLQFSKHVLKKTDFKVCSMVMLKILRKTASFPGLLYSKPIKNRYSKII